MRPLAPVHLPDSRGSEAAVQMGVGLDIEFKVIRGRGVIRGVG